MNPPDVGGGGMVLNCREKAILEALLVMALSVLKSRVVVVPTWQSPHLAGWVSIALAALNFGPSVMLLSSSFLEQDRLKNRQQNSNARRWYMV